MGCKTVPGHFFKKTFSNRSRKPRTPALPLHSGTVIRVSDQQPRLGLRSVLWCEIDEGIFFNLNLKFAPMGS
jgi:hypothetical protein